MTTEYISCSTNSHPRSVDWGKNGLIVYGSSNALAIYDPDVEDAGRILETLHKHTSQVKIAQWITRDKKHPENEILSGSIDGTVIIWRQENDSYLPEISLNLGDNLTTAHAIYSNDDKQNNDLLICASSFKEIFSIWQRKSGSISEKQTIDLKGKIPTEALFNFLPGPSETPIVIIALDDASMQIFAWNNYKNEETPNFTYARTLTGHQDWIQCFDYMKNADNEALLTTGSQDGTIRLWKISIAEEKPDDEKINHFKIKDEEYEVMIESVLSGHEHWVYGINWLPPVLVNDKWKRENRLLSCALDQSMIVWSPNESGVWVENARLGKVGGNTLGYYGCRFNADGTSVLAHGYKGTFHMWRFDKESDRWLPRSAPSGHNSDVTDIHWDPKGRYLISTSLDQTTRIHIPWIQDEEKKLEIWKEIGRPQIHGYDINGIEILTSTMFASGADEKVVRIFKAPDDFLNCLNENKWINPRKITDRAQVPALGLTNKAITNDDRAKEEGFEEDDIDCERAPTEEEIVRHTLWPEIEKLYGHGYEIFSMAARHDAKILATACKSSSEEHSSIILWSSKTWSQVQKLYAHRLTVAQMEFSPNDEYLVSVSRDRRWALYHCQEANEENNYKLVFISPSSGSLHTRIIWCCAWTHDSKFFATGSRDGKIGVWSVEKIHNYEINEKPKAIAELEIKGASVTALTFSTNILPDNNYLIVVGVEEGTIELYRLNIDDEISKWRFCMKLDTSSGHHKTVKRVLFRPVLKFGRLQLASCGSDKAVKIHNIDIANILNPVDN